MDREKQIEEMANEIYETLMLEAECPLSGMDRAIIADLLVGKGYRKASDVAKEIFEEIEKVFTKRIAFYTDMKKQRTLFFVEQYAETMITNCNIYLQEIAELKKKYTGEETYNDRNN